MSLVEAAMRPPSQLGYVFDGIPRTVRQGQLLSDLLARLGAKIDLVILLDVDEETVRTRLLERAKIEGRSDDTANTIEHRLAVYEAESAPLVDGYGQLGALRTVNGSGTPDEVFEQVQRALDEMTAGDPARNAS